MPSGSEVFFSPFKSLSQLFSPRLNVNFEEEVFFGGGGAGPPSSFVRRRKLFAGRNDELSRMFCMCPPRGCTPTFRVVAACVALGVVMALVNGMEDPHAAFGGRQLQSAHSTKDDASLGAEACSHCVQYGVPGMFEKVGCWKCKTCWSLCVACGCFQKLKPKKHDV